MEFVRYSRSVRGEGDAVRCEATDLKQPEACSLEYEYVGDFFMVAAIEGSMSDRLLARTFALNDCRRGSKENLDIGPE